MATEGPHSLPPRISYLRPIEGGRRHSPVPQQRPPASGRCMESIWHAFIGTATYAAIGHSLFRFFVPTEENQIAIDNKLVLVEADIALVPRSGWDSFKTRSKLLVQDVVWIWGGLFLVGASEAIRQVLLLGRRRVHALPLFKPSELYGNVMRDCEPPNLRGGWRRLTKPAPLRVVKSIEDNGLHLSPISKGTATGILATGSAAYMLGKICSAIAVSVEASAAASMSFLGIGLTYFDRQFENPQNLL